jgi:hypothetical protein
VANSPLRAIGGGLATPTGPWGGLGHPKGQMVALRVGLATPKEPNQTKNKNYIFLLFYFIFIFKK